MVLGIEILNYFGPKEIGLKNKCKQLIQKILEQFGINYQ
jgi:hypothetical protein